MKKTFGIFTVALLLIAGGVSAFGFMSDDEDRLSEEHFNKIVEMHKIMTQIKEQKEIAKQAVEEENYEMWKEAMENIIELKEQLPEHPEHPHKGGRCGCGKNRNRIDEKE